MSKNQLRTLFALLLAGLMLLSLAACGSKAGPEPDGPTPPDQSQDADSDTDQDQEEQESPDTQPEPAPEPAPEPEPDPEPEPEPEPADLAGEYSGEFSSDTQTALNLVVKWAARREADGTYAVTLRFYLDTYSLEVGERDSNTVKIVTSAGTKESHFRSGRIEKEDNERQAILLGEKTVSLTAEELADGAKATVTWDFRGSYSGKELPSVTATGLISGN